ncbi:MAG: MFS transporter [Alphaproteobacteria bacterium]|nr:MFS transporter [Alphaproteobacteria bacterium]
MDKSHDTAASRWVLVLTSVASLMVALDAMVVTMALNTIHADLRTSIEALEWTVNAYNLTFAVLLLTGTALGDRFGRRRLFMAGLGLFMTASAGCALAEDAAWLIAARALQGVGAALVMPLGMALLGVAFPREQRGKALGIFSSITGIALIAGPLVGGAIAEGIAWQWIFWINVPIGLILLPLIRTRIPESVGPRAPLDIGGLVLVTGAAFGVIWGLMSSTRHGWSDPESSASLAAGIVLGSVFVAWEKSVSAPMVPMSFFRVPAFSSAIAASWLFYAAMYGTLFLLPQFLQVGQSATPLGAGLRLLPWTATLFVFAPIGGNLIRRAGERRIVIIGLLMQAAGMVWVALVARPDLPYIGLVAPLILTGAGVSLAMPAAQNAILGAVAPTEIGKASGIFNMFRYLGGAFGIVVQVAVLGGAANVPSAESFSAGFARAMATAAALSLVGAIVATGLPRRSSEPQLPATSPTTRTRTRTELPGR